MGSRERVPEASDLEPAQASPLRMRCRLDETAGALRDGKGDILAAARELVGRAERVDPVLRALVPEPGRLGRVLAEARRVEGRFPLERSRPSLFGVPVVVKDVIAVEGLPTRAGSILPAGLFELPEAAIVRALRYAGAYVLGKGTTTELAILGPAPTRNPHDLERTSGGSSSGPAAAVAAGISPLAIGTQTVGSIIRPAAYCGVVGFKPTYRRIPTTGLLVGCPSFDTVGLFTQDTLGMQRASSAVLRDWRGLPPSEQRPLRLGVPTGPQLELVDEDGADAFARATECLQRAGHTLVDVPVLADLEEIIARHFRLVAAELAHSHAALFAQYGTRYGPAAQALIERGSSVPREEWGELQASQPKLRRKLESCAEAHSLDAWVSPPARGVAPRGFESTGDPTPALSWTHAGLPVLSLPCGFSDAGLPFGLQVAGHYGRDEELLELAHRIAPILDQAN